jgi:hypothetical protein
MCFISAVIIIDSKRMMLTKKRRQQLGHQAIEPELKAIHERKTMSEVGHKDCAPAGEGPYSADDCSKIYECT